VYNLVSGIEQDLEDKEASKPSLEMNRLPVARSELLRRGMRRTLWHWVSHAYPATELAASRNKWTAPRGDRGGTEWGECTMGLQAVLYRCGSSTKLCGRRGVGVGQSEPRIWRSPFFTTAVRYIGFESSPATIIYRLANSTEIDAAFDSLALIGGLPVSLLVSLHLSLRSLQ